MTAYENLMVTAMEECAEIQEEISKALRFGINNYHPDDPALTNGERILIEYQQLRAVINKLIMDGHIKALSEKDSNLVYKNKLQKIELYQQYSKEIGTIAE